MQPALITLNWNGQQVAAVAVGTKVGHIFILDRESSEPLFPIQERPVPQTDVSGEETWPTQPFPTQLPLCGLRHLSPDDAWGPAPEQRAAGREWIASLRSDGPFTPVSLRGSIEAPSNVGGFNWGGLSYDPARQLLVRATNRIAGVVQLTPRAESASDQNAGNRFSLETGEQRGTPYVLTRTYLLNSETRLPYSPPPWGTLVAVDLGDGSLAWEAPLGFMADPAEFPDAPNWGSINLSR